MPLKPILLRLLLLIGIGQVEIKAALAQEACVAEQVASLPLRNTGYSLTIIGSINGKPLSFIVDTGSEGSLLTPEGLKGLALSASTDHQATIIGADGKKHNVPLIPIKKLTLGELTLTDQLFPLGNMPGVPMITPPVWGLLGMDVLGHYDLDIDLPHHTLTLWAVQLRSLLCRPPPYGNVQQENDGQKNSWKILAPHLQNGRFALDFTLDGVKGLGLLDSGARSHILNTHFAHRTGVSDDILATDPGGINSGISAINATSERLYHWHRFHQLVIAGEVFTSPVLTVSPLHTQIDMLIGADYFLTHRLWLSPATQKIYLQTLKIAPKATPSNIILNKKKH